MRKRIVGERRANWDEFVKNDIRMAGVRNKGIKGKDRDRCGET